MKKLLWILLAILAAAIGIGALLYSNLDAIAKTAIQEAGSKILQVKVAVDKVKLSPTDGAGALSGLEIGNPTAFKAPYAMKASTIELAVEPKSLTTNVIHIRKVRATGVSLHYESGDKGTNFDAIQHNAQKFSGPAKAETQPKKFIIDNLVISGARMVYQGSATLGKPVELSLPDITINHIGTKEGGVTADHMVKAILGAMMRSMGHAVSESAKGAAKAVGDSVKGLFGK